ncbi:cytochrome P450 [Desarmillaria tabescens]|uniref:Cytochrome P450 n=1 Tax=Armillaria tabescens TaxID=1929756 RepID=A0AA39MWM2_ARMTA|nr:cytochrome P450 [Desarmillaria tabescens]KAK0448923.1 cytochrome P450 [Desarmillaria tabescens]
MALKEYFELPWRVDIKTFVIRGLGIVTAFLLVLQVRKALKTSAKLKHIPGLIMSWIDALKFIFHAKAIIQEGYTKYYGSAFKVPLIDKWMVVVSGAEKVDDIRRSSLEQLSSLDAIIDLLQMNHTMGYSLCVDPYHAEVVRGALTRNIATRFADVHDGIKAAFEDNIPMTEDWIEVSAYQTVLQIVCRVSNRMFIGLPICRDPDYIKLNIDFTIGVFVYSRIINLFPRIFKPHPEYTETLRAEVESVINAEGCTKAAMGKMNQLDSFLKEAQSVRHCWRFRNASCRSKRLRSFGRDCCCVRNVWNRRSLCGHCRVILPTYLPTGTEIAVAALATNTDEWNYENPSEFRPWRFSDRRKQEGENLHHRMVTPSLDFIFCGHGRPACPGRFFAVNNLKALMSYVLLNFDVKMDTLPSSTWLAGDQIPDQSIKALFRKRVYTYQSYCFSIDMGLQENVNLAQQVDIALLLRSLGLAATFLLAWQLRKAIDNRAKLKAIPTVGSSGIITSWKDAFRFVFHAKEIIQEGHRMLLQIDYTIGRRFNEDSYHTDVVRGSLTHNIGTRFADVQDEIQAAFKDNIPVTEGWIEVPAYRTILQIVCRASNRITQGRNRDYIKLNINYTINVVVCAHIIRLFPSILKPIVGSIFTPRRHAAAKMEKFLGQTIRERLHQDDAHGKDGRESRERRTVQDLIIRMLGLNFAAIHTTSMTSIVALYALAAHSEYVQILRDEVETTIVGEGWTKAAMGKMNKLDSFVKEAQRLYGGIGAFSMLRLVKKDFIFSDGTVVPAGNQIAVAAYPTHMDEENYEDPLEFKPWRFSDKRTKEGEDIRHQMVTTSIDYLLFGNGRPVCPGRFFAVNELKALMSYVLLNFDVKIDKVPETRWFLSDQFPNQSSMASSYTIYIGQYVNAIMMLFLALSGYHRFRHCLCIPQLGNEYFLPVSVRRAYFTEVRQYRTKIGRHFAAGHPGFVLCISACVPVSTGFKQPGKGIPTVGSSRFIASWKDALKFHFPSKEIIEEGYRKYYGSVFKVPLLDKWIIVVSGAEKIDEIRKSSPEQLSSLDATSDLLQMDYTMGSSVAADPYHIDIVRNALTRNIAVCFADVTDEIQAAFNDNIQTTEGTNFNCLFRLHAYQVTVDWINVPVHDKILQIVCRASNRMFVGLPLCRTEDYIKLNINFTVNVFVCAHIINIFPSFLKPIVGFLLTPRRRFSSGGEITRSDYSRTTAQRGPPWKGLARETGKELLNDLLSWLLDATKDNKEKRTVQDLTTRLLALNLGAIHTTSMVFKTAVYTLAAHPEYVQILRTEVESAIAEEGWTKSAVSKMDLLDSFLKEAQRLYGDLGVFGVRRTAREDFIFSDGTIVPAGSHIAVAALSTHVDEKNYEDPLQFRPWRFSERKQEGGGIHQQMVTPSLDYVLFGIGRSACPGRFFAIDTLKTLMTHVLLNFDVKTDGISTAGQLPTHQDRNNDIFFRKRARTP